MFGNRLMSHPSRSAQKPHISPTSPQMWITPVYKAVDNCIWVVRFAGSVRLSPSVDRLWTNHLTDGQASPLRCAQSGGSCARQRSARGISTGTHTPRGTRSTVRAHARSHLLRPITPPVHSFPNPYDDYYLKNSIDPANDYALPAVDRSRTLGVLGRCTCPREHPRTYSRISVKGGHE